MIMPAHYEESMKELSELKDKSDLMSDKLKIKAVEDTVDVLKQFGYDSGAIIFKQIILGELNESK